MICTNTGMEYVAIRRDESDGTPCRDVDGLGGVRYSIVEAPHVHAHHIHQLRMDGLGEGTLRDTAMRRTGSPVVF